MSVMPIRRGPRAHVMRGFTLIELMIALLLGLMVSGAAVALFITNRQTYIASESLSRVQENARTAFELMARDVREAAGNACGTALNNTVNVLKSPTNTWYTDFAGGIRGYGSTEAFADAPFGTGLRDRVSGTDAIELKSSLSSGTTVEGHNPTSAQIKVNTKNHTLNEGDIALICDSNHAAIFQISNASPGTNVTVVHNTGNTVTPGNCTHGLGSPLDCSNPGNPYQFGCAFGGVSLPPGTTCADEANTWTAIVAKMRASRWYIGHNGRGGRSLYMKAVTNQADVALASEEITEGVNDMTLEYLSEGGAAYQPAGPGINWNTVIAVRINLEMAGKEKIGTDGNVLQRDLLHVVTIRNRAP